MRRFSSRFVLVSLVLGLAAAPAVAKGDAKRAPAPAKTAPQRKGPPVSAENKKKLAELYGGFKFGMSKDEVLGVLKKQLDQKYEEKIKATTDVRAQDTLRAEKKTELARVSSSYIAFDGKRTGWDVSIIEEEFAHNTGESMFERWENSSGKNQRRFFFFHEGKLWKMLVSLDVSIIPEDKKNFETFQGVMQGQYGPGDVEPGLITWRTDEFHVRAVDKLKIYDALALVIEDPRVKQSLIALREAKAPPKHETSPVIKSVIDTDKSDKPDVKSNGNAVDAVIKAQGGGGTPKP
ncbi:MAG TPA: hypothetical protein VN253_17200 [Kofleriaceae bacterium]|nr:hypothetical protein [Kofleriaceae bacterium]